MTYKFGRRSKANLFTAETKLQEIAYHVIKIIDHSVLQGHRGEEKQDDMFHSGLSKLEWPNSKHNSSPSKAIDVAPYPIDWNDLEKFRNVAMFTRGIGAGKGVEIRLGMDWDSDFTFRDQRFHDIGHVEIVL